VRRVAVALLVVVAACGGSETEPAAEPSSLPTALVPGQEVTLSGPLEESSAFVEGAGVLLEGGGEITLSFNTSGGPATGSFTQTLVGEDNEGASYTVSYSGTLTGSYDAQLNEFEGTYSYTFSIPDGFEAALPTDEVWDGGAVVTSEGCGSTEIECVFGATQPNVDILWELALPPDLINPAFLESVGQ
jgi:hypothetical protein